MADIYLTNAATVNSVLAGRGSAGSRSCVGPGPVLTIMAAPRPLYGEAGEGRVPVLVPGAELREGLRTGRLTREEYRAGYGLQLARVALELQPGGLMYEARGVVGAVPTGATLVCACSRAQAMAGWCHRVWAAAALRGAGWRVVLDADVLR